MSDWLLSLIGIDSEVRANAGAGTIRFESPSVLWFGVPLLVVLGWFVHRRLRQSLPDASRSLIRVLTATRVLVVLILVVILANPVLKIDLNETKRPVVALLVDTSSSMNLPLSNLTDEEERAFAPLRLGSLREMSRGRLAVNVLKRSEPTLFRAIEERFDLRLFTFSRDLHFVENAKLPESFEATGSGTHLGVAVQCVFDELKGTPVAGMILVSDGESTGGVSIAEAAEAARRQETPILTLPVGSTARFKDVSIVDVSTSGEVSVGDTARVGVVIESQGFDSESATVQLRDGDRVVQSKGIHLRDGARQQIELAYTATEEGAKYLQVEVAPLRGEAIESNNADLAFLRVTKAKRKVLYLEGPPRWDFRFLKNGLRRDSGLEGRQGKQVDIVLENEWRLQPEARRQEVLPRSVEEFADYDVVILGDVSPKMLDDKLVKNLDRAVREKGVGLLIEVGPQSMPHVFDRPLQALLPIQVQDRKPGIEAPVGKPFTLELSRDGLRHEAMRLHDDVEKNRTLWSEMLPYAWCVAGVKAAPGATVLAWNPAARTEFGKLPLIAWHYVGAGKVMLVGTDSTWLWRQNVGERFFYKFWGQSVRFVARQDTKKQSRVEVSPVRVQPGEEAEVELLAYSESGEPLSDGKVTMRSPGGEEAVPLTADRNRPGRFTGTVRVKHEGTHEFVFSPTVAAKLQVRVSPEELRHPNVNRSALRSLSEASGGQMIELHDPELESKIQSSLKGETKTLSRKLRATLWDNALVLFLLVGLFCFDIALRRLSGLS